MSADKHARNELNDLQHKVQNAKDTATEPEASDREKADLKLLEQEAAAQKLKAKHPTPKTPKTESEIDAKLDKALSDSFPGSDPVSFVEAAPIKPHDRNLSTVPDQDEKK